jgi:peroxiredoxin
VQLQESLQAFKDAGIGVVALTYDKPELQQQFIEQRGIEYPFLSDIDAYTMNTLGILDENYKYGEHHYGIPHPGIFILNAELDIVGKIFVNGYEKRVKAEAVLSYAQEILN